MTADDILTQIDHALEDWTVSDDAMRSRPEPDAPAEPSGIRGATPTVQIWDEFGEWQELTGVASVEIQMEDPPIPQEFREEWARLSAHLARREAERVRRAREALEAFARYAQSVKPAVEAAGRALAELQQTAQASPAAPGRRRDRPAWQSPYGPAQRRR